MRLQLAVVVVAGFAGAAVIVVYHQILENWVHFVVLKVIVGRLARVFEVPPVDVAINHVVDGFLLGVEVIGTGQIEAIEMETCYRVQTYFRDARKQWDALY